MIKPNYWMRYPQPLTGSQLLDDKTEFLDEISLTHHQQTASIQLLRAIWHDDTAGVTLITTTAEPVDILKIQKTHLTKYIGAGIRLL